MNEVIFDISKFTQTIISFSELLRTENQLLSKMKISDIEHLRADKENLSEIVVQFDKMIKHMPEILRNQPKDHIDHLKIHYLEFMSLAEENFKLLERATIANQGIVEKIKKQIIKDIESKQSYGKTKKKKTTLPPVTLKESI